MNFGEFRNPEGASYAGPKGANLAKMFQSQSLRNKVPDGFILPFGFFGKYSEAVGIKPWMELLSKTKLENTLLVSLITNKIIQIIGDKPLPEDLMNEALSALSALKERTGHEGGYFVRSDTNIEDLENFNGAGLNESVANVKADRDALDRAIRRVWASPFTEKSIYWRGSALGQPTVTIALPSVVVLPTVSARSSGVLISKGGTDWIEGKGALSANWGIGSVVEAGNPVEEISFEGNAPLRYSQSVSASRPVPNANGGLTLEPVAPGTPVLSARDISLLQSLSSEISPVLGDQRHGWDIEWAIDQEGNLRILQARPNM